MQKPTEPEMQKPVEPEPEMQKPVEEPQQKEAAPVLLQEPAPGYQLLTPDAGVQKRMIEEGEAGTMPR